MKYFNQIVSIDGIKFASKKEAKRYSQLKLLEKAKVIQDLQLQKKFELQPKYTNSKGEHIRAITYICDFYYYDVEHQKFVVEDTKGFRTDVYKLKKKIFEYKYPTLSIKEIWYGNSIKKIRRPKTLWKQPKI